LEGSLTNEQARNKAIKLWGKKTFISCSKYVDVSPLVYQIGYLGWFGSVIGMKEFEGI
jgi:hypothetical protein